MFPTSQFARKEEGERLTDLITAGDSKIPWREIDGYSR
jgi:hypothetical protein